MREIQARIILDRLLRVMEESSEEWRNIRDLRSAPDFDIIRDRLIKRLMRDMEMEHPSAQSRFYEECSKLFRRQNHQLDRIEYLLSERSPGCRFAESEDGRERFSELITIKSTLDGNRSLGNHDADPESFTEALKKSVKKTTAIVLVDPYALASKGNGGSAISAISTITDIVDSARDVNAGHLAAVHLHLYCRMDAMDLGEWSLLKESLGSNRLSVYFGDFHDRYILAGQDQEHDASNWTDGWHGKKWWAGAAFGSSINGVGKRPTYVLNFKKADIRPIIAYTRGVVETETSWEALNKANPIS